MAKKDICMLIKEFYFVFGILRNHIMVHGEP